jgi:hypothetical protein
MLKKAITFTNIDGETVTEDFWFQITASDIAKKAVIEGEDYGKRLESLSVEKDGAIIIQEFENILSDAVGRREGMRFVKNQEIRDYFLQSGAYDAFFMELMTSPDSGASVLTGIFPANIQEQLQKALRDRGITIAELPDLSTDEKTEIMQKAGYTQDDISGVLTDARVQAEKPQPEFQQAVQADLSVHPTPPEFQGVISEVTPVPALSGKDDEPAWLRETRYPTKQELMRMGSEEMQLAMKMKAAKAFD